MTPIKIQPLQGLLIASLISFVLPAGISAQEKKTPGLILNISLQPNVANVMRCPRETNYPVKTQQVKNYGPGMSC